LITTYEVQSVLRVYGNQLKKKSSNLEESPSPSGSADLVDISMSARRRQMLSRISHQLISALTPAQKKDDQAGSAPELLMNQG
jgi:hypothetical protein